MPVRRPAAFERALATTAAAALAVRIAYTLLVGRRIEMIGDARTYYGLGQNLADGLGYIRPERYEQSGAIVPTADYPPLFPVLLAGVNRLGGRDLLTQKLVMCGVGSGTVAVIGLIGRLAGGDVVGLGAAGIAAVHPMLFQPDGALMAETAYAATSALTVLAAMGVARRPGPLGFGLLGLAIGAATMSRSEAVLLQPLLVAPLAIGRGDRTGALVAAMTTGAVVGAWTLRNWVRLGHFVPLTNNSGGLVFGSNFDPVFFGRFEGLWLYTRFFGYDSGDLDETELSRQYLREGLQYAAEHWQRLPRVMAIRVLRTWGLWDPPGQINAECLEGRTLRWQTVGHRLHLAMLPLAALGVRAARRQGVPIAPLVATGTMVSITSALSYGNQRWRAGAEPAYAVLAALGGVSLWRGARRALTLGPVGR